MGIADELITRGWHQGEAEAPTGEVCLAGAAAYALFNTTFDDLSLHDLSAAMNAVEAAAPEIAKHGVGNWNDAPERTFDEVLRVAKEADEILDAQ